MEPPTRRADVCPGRREAKPRMRSRQVQVGRAKAALWCAVAGLSPADRIIALQTVLAEDYRDRQSRPLIY
jgi:hypothetical protein